VNRTAVLVSALCLIAPAAYAEDAMDHTTPTPAATAAAPAHLTVDAPLAPPLAKGAVIIQFHTGDLKIAPIYGAEGLAANPRVGHLHITLDNASWHWVHAGPDPLAIQGLAPGPHTVRVDLADPTHKVIETQSVSFVVPEPPKSAAK
jgi:hypothetical protein